MFKKWREYFRLANITLTPEHEARYIRLEAAYDQALETFGDDEKARAWMLTHSNDLGVWVSPSEIAEMSDGGLARVLARLAQIALEVHSVEVTKPKLKWSFKRFRRFLWSRSL